MGAQWWVGTLPWPICSNLTVTLKGIMQSRMKNNQGRKITVILSIIFCRRRKSDLLRGRGSSLSRDPKAFLTPGATSSSSRGSPRCSQASWETRALQRLLVLPWGLLPVNASLRRHPEQVPKPTQLATPNTQVASHFCLLSKILTFQAPPNIHDQCLEWEHRLTAKSSDCTPTSIH